MSGDWKIHAQRVTTGEWLTRDLELSKATTSRALSGPGGVFGVLEPEQLRLYANDGRPLIEEWTTALYAEEDGQIRAGGIVNKVEYDKPIKTVDAGGFSAYPVGIPYMNDYVPVDFPDPIEVFKHVWNYVQSFPNAQLDMQVTGTPETWFATSNGQGPFRMYFHEYRDCGDTLDMLARAVPFDYVEKHTWADAQHLSVKHEIEVGFPRVGRRRSDLRFADGENIIDWSPIAANGDTYANDVYLFGRGEGRGMLRSRAAVQDGRLRRAAVITNKAATQGLLDREAQRELRMRELRLDIREVTIQDSINARISAIQPGDDIPVELDVEWIGDVTMWLRVLSIEEAGDRPDVAVLRTQRSDSFAYMAPHSPTGERQVITL